MDRTIPPTTPAGLPARPDEPTRGDDRTRVSDDKRRDATRPVSGRPEGDDVRAPAADGADTRSAPLDLSTSVAGEEDPGADVEELRSDRPLRTERETAGGAAQPPRSGGPAER